MRNDLPIIDPTQLCAELAKRGETWADANAAAAALEETRQSVYASIAAEHLATGESAAKAELLAKADPRYRDHLTAMVKAMQARDRARVRFDTYKAYIELMRSAESSRRAEMGIR